MFEKVTSDRSGVTVTIPVLENDYNNFRKEIRNQLAYFDNIYFDVELKKTHQYSYGYIADEVADLNTDFTIYREKDFQYSSLSKMTEMHLTLGKVNYPIDWKSLGISSINMPVALKFDLDCGIFPIPNRENLIWNKRTKEIVLEKLKLVADWFVTKYNSNVKKSSTLYQAWEYIMKTDYNVDLYGKNFHINSLSAFSTINIQEVEIDKMVYLKPKIFRLQYDLILANLKPVARKDWNNRIATKNIWNSIDHITKGKGTCAIIGDSCIISGFYREYLKTLGFKYFYKRVDSPIDYEKALSLKNFDPKIWKDVIKECEMFIDQFIKEATADITNVQNEAIFEQFKKDHKAKAKTTLYNGLNKQKDELTVMYAENKRYGGKYFKKQTFTMDKLRKHKFLTVFVDDNVDATNICQIYKRSTVRFARIGVQDLKKIEKTKLNNFMTQRQMEKTKLFTRTATAIFAKRVCSDFELLMTNHMAIVNLPVLKLKDTYLKVKNYVTMIASDEKCSRDMENSMLEIAEQSGNWDNSIIFEVKKLKEAIVDFKFITLLTPPKTEGDKHDYENHITSMLLFKKLKYQEKLENLEIVNKK